VNADVKPGSKPLTKVFSSIVAVPVLLSLLLSIQAVSQKTIGIAAGYNFANMNTRLAPPCHWRKTDRVMR
jgi:hypothetical protein